MSNYLIGMKINDDIKLIHSINAESKEDAKARYKTAFHCALRTSSTIDDIIIIGTYENGFLELENEIQIKKCSSGNVKNATHKKCANIYDKLSLDKAPEFVNQKNDNPFNNNRNMIPDKAYTPLDRVINFKSRSINNLDDLVLNIDKSRNQNSNLTTYISKKSQNDPSDKLYLVRLDLNDNQKGLCHHCITRAKNAFEAQSISCRKIEKMFAITPTFIIAEQLYLYYIEYADSHYIELIYDTADFKLLSEYRQVVVSTNKEYALSNTISHATYRHVVRFCDWDDTIKERVKNMYPEWEGGEYEF